MVLRLSPVACVVWHSNMENQNPFPFSISVFWNRRERRFEAECPDLLVYYLRSCKSGMVLTAGGGEQKKGVDLLLPYDIINNFKR